MYPQTLTIDRRLTAEDIYQGGDYVNPENDCQLCAIAWLRVAGGEDPICGSIPDSMRERFPRQSKFTLWEWSDSTDPSVVAETLNEFFVAEGILKAEGKATP